MNPRTGFLIELAAGGLSLILYLALGTQGLILLVLFGFRAIIRENSNSDDEFVLSKMYRTTFRISIATTALFLLMLLSIEGSALTSSHEWFRFLLPFLPFYFMVHGIVGLILVSRHGESHESS